MAHDILRAQWRKSSRSGGNGNCVEIADLVASIGVRDSKAPDVGHLNFAHQVWAAFLSQAKAGRYDR
ncbi:DUF397 domain-containing protein [Actinomadura sp. NAK00032]|nr:DUF397 domain-containing protein [Actinomadura sp. NAK00032]